MKKSKFKREICLGLTESKRCRTCLFWQKRSALEMGSTFGMTGKEADTMYLLKLKGCEVLKEICPNCIVDLSSARHNDAVARAQGCNDQIVCEPAFVYPILGNNFKPKGKKLYCSVCEKTFTHSQVKHLIDTMKILKAENPERWKTTFKQRLIYWFRDFKKVINKK